MFSRLHEMFELKVMSYIFVPQINILQSIGSAAATKASRQARMIVSNPLKYIPNRAKEISEILQNILQYCHQFEDNIKEVKQYGYSELYMRQPQLFKKSAILTEFEANYRANQQQYTRFSGRSIFKTKAYCGFNGTLSLI